jgi:hypothetical protein
VERTTIAGETEVLGENPPQRHFVPPQIPHDQVLFRTPDRSGGKPATNRLSYGAAFQRRFRQAGKPVLLPGIDSQFPDCPGCNLVTLLNEISSCKCRYNAFSVCSSLTRSNLCVGIINQSTVEASDMGLHVPN